jgi:hypothetical protein
MRKLQFSRPSPAMVVALIALFVALSGGAAAGTYVATKQLHGHASLQAARASALSSRFARMSRLGPSRIVRPSRFDTREPRGPRGPRGPKGPPGGFTTANLAQVAGSTVHLCAFGGGDCAVGSAQVSCPAGKAVLGGGWIGDSPDPPISATVAYNGPTSASGWGVIMTNDTSATTASYHAVAVCAG